MIINNPDPSIITDLITTQLILKHCINNKFTITDSLGNTRLTNFYDKLMSVTEINELIPIIKKSWSISTLPDGTYDFSSLLNSVERQLWILNRFDPESITYDNDDICNHYHLVMFNKAIINNNIIDPGSLESILLEIESVI